jgi:glutamate/tyrosine decarboxylase-like PLP-dependent enzyme
MARERRRRHNRRVDAWESVVQQARGWPDGVGRHAVSPALSDAQIREQLGAADFGEPRALGPLVDRIGALLAGGTLHATHPRYFGLFVPGVRPAGVIGDTLAAVYNLQLGAWWHAPAASHLERLVLDFFARRLGMDPDAGHATFTTGGSEANLTAVLAALATAVPGFADRGLAAAGARPVFYVSEHAHDSAIKIARVVGLGGGAVRRIAADGEQRLDPAALASAITADRRAGCLPFLAIATLGTTATGAVDPIAALARVCRAARLWLHVDAAWGGMAALTDRLRPCLDGLEHADSITCDAHKILPVPMGAGMFFCRSAAPTDAVFSVRTGYVPDGDAGRPDAYQHTLQWSRRCIGLKVFLTLAELGEAGVAALIDRQLEMAARLRRRLARAGWLITNRTPLPLVCWTHPALQDAGVDELTRTIAGDGVAWISAVRLPDGRRWLRACVTNADTAAADVDALVEALDGAFRNRGGRRRPAT